MVEVSKGTTTGSFIPITLLVFRQAVTSQTRGVISQDRLDTHSCDPSNPSLGGVVSSGERCGQHRLAFVSNHIGSCSVLMYGAVVSFFQVATGVVGHWRPGPLISPWKLCGQSAASLSGCQGVDLGRCPAYPEYAVTPNLENSARCPSAH